MYQLAAHRRSCQAPQRLPLIAFPCCDRNLHYLVHSHSTCSPEPFDDCVGADTLLDVFFQLFEYFTGQDHNGCRPITYFSVLAAGNVGKDTGSWVNYF